MLHAWVTKKHEQTKSPTLENLKSALQSNTVGLGGAAHTLQEKIMKAGMAILPPSTFLRISGHFQK